MSVNTLTVIYFIYYLLLLGGAYLVYALPVRACCRRINECANCALRSICSGDHALTAGINRFPSLRISHADIGKTCSGLKERVLKQESELGLWKYVMKGCNYCSVRVQKETGAENAPSVVGWADKAVNQIDPTLVLGFEPWVLRIETLKFGFFFKWLTNSVISHELEHCRQEGVHGWLSERWDKSLNRRRYLWLWLRAEYGAVTAAPASTLTFVFFLIWPALNWLYLINHHQ